MSRHPIPAAALEQHVAILGKTGSGKTSTAKLAIEQVVEDGARVCILDPIKSDWWGLTSSASGKSAGLPFHILGGPHGHVPLHASAGKAIGEIVATGALPLSIIDMADFEPGGQARFFIDFAPTLLRKIRGVVYLVIEEAHLFAPKERSGLGAENMSIHWAKTIATAGRSKGIRLILLTQRTQALHNALLGSCDTMIAHRLTAPADQEPVVKWLKANVDKETTALVAGSISSLKTGEGWVCSGEAKIFERVQFPRIHTYDNTATPTGKGDVQEVKTAQVDQDKLRAIIGDAVKEAESNDPKRLKAELARLKAELAKKAPAAPAGQTAAAPAGKQPATSEFRALQQRLRAAASLLENTMKFIATVRTIGFPEKIDAKKLETAITAAVQRVGDQINTEFGAKRRAFDKWQADGEKLLASVQALLKAEVPIDVTVKHNEPFSVAARAPAQPAPAPRTPAQPMEGVTRSQQKILESLAMLESMGITQPSRTQLALWSEVSSTSGGYFNNLGALRTGGLIDYPSGGTVALTDAGRARTPTPEPMSAEEMQTALCARVGASKAAILRALIEIYPEQISRDELAKKIGVSSTSGGYFNNLGALRTLGVIDYPTPGFAVALPVLFLEAA